jgi:hypothetical protein
LWDGETVFSDAAADVVIASSGRDWAFEDPA